MNYIELVTKTWYLNNPNNAPRVVGIATRVAFRMFCGNPEATWAWVVQERGGWRAPPPETQFSDWLYQELLTGRGDTPRGGP